MCGPFGWESDGFTECRKAVRERREAGAKVIKIMASGGLSDYPHEDYCVPEFTDEELHAIMAAARAGVDSVEHGVHLDGEVLDMMVSIQMSYVPTVANMQQIARAIRAVAVATQTTSADLANKAGVNIGIGTDSTGTYLQEIIVRRQLGMTKAQIIR